MEGRISISSSAFPSSLPEFPCFPFDSPWRQEILGGPALLFSLGILLFLHLLCVCESPRELFRTESLILSPSSLILFSGMGTRDGIRNPPGGF